MMGFYVNLFTVDASFEMGPRWIFHVNLERERQRERDRDRETERETERQRQRQRDRQRHRERQRETERQRKLPHRGKIRHGKVKF